MKIKKIHINYSCNKKWEELLDHKDNVKHCTQCKERVKDYTKVGIEKIDSSCGRFSLAQVSSFDRQIHLNLIKTPVISLMMVLGLSAISTVAVSQANENVNTEIVLGLDTNKLVITGKLINRETREPLSNGVVEVYHQSQIIAVSVTDEKGQFALNLDGKKYALKELSVSFTQPTPGILTDTIPIGVKNLENLILELKVDTEASYFNDIQITGVIDGDRQDH